MIPSVARPPGLIVGRASRAGVIALSIIALILAGCRADEASLPSEPAELSLAGKGNCPGDAIQLINALFSRGLRNAITQQCNNIERQFSRGNDADALSKLESLIAKILEHQEEGQTNDTTGPLGFGSGEAVLRLIGELNEIVGQPGLGGLPAGIDPFAPAGAVEVCQAGETCEIVGGDEFSGIQIPSNVQFLLNGLPYDGPVTIYIAPLPSDESPFPGFTLGETTFPLFRFFGSIPEGLEFSGEVLGAVCVLDPPHSLAPDPEDIPDLRLAHLENGDVVPLPLRDASGLIDCTGVNATVPEEAALWRGAVDALLGPAAWFLDVPPLHAKPGALGGRVSAFSPFGAVLPDAVELSCNTATFEGVGDSQPVGLVSGFPSMTFGGSWLGLIDSDAGGGGNFANEPSPSTTAFHLDTEDILITLGTGSRTVSVFYTASNASLPVTLEAFNGAGGLVDQTAGNTSGNAFDGAACSGDPTGDFCLWDTISVSSPTDDIQSIRISGVSNQFAIDDLQVCTGGSVVESRVPRALTGANAVVPPRSIRPRADAEPSGRGLRIEQ